MCQYALKGGRDLVKKVFRQMLLAQILSSMTVMICMLIDNIVIGRELGIDAMKAYELASPVLLIFAAIGTTLSAGVQVLCGKAMGRSDRKGTNECFSSAIALALIIAGIGLFFVMIFTGPLCTMLGAGSASPDNPVYDLTKRYLQGFIIGAPAFILAQISVPFLQMSGNRKMLVIAVVSMTGADIILDILNVMPFINGGMFGMGMASSISYYVALGIGMVVFLNKKFPFRFRLKHVRFKVFRKLLRYGLPTVVSQICFALLTYAINMILNNVDSRLGVAAYSVISTVGNISFSVGNGIGAVAMMLASIFYSDEDRSSIRQVVKTMSFYALTVNAVLTAALAAVAWPVAKLFLTDHPDAVNMTTAGLRFFALSLVPCGLNTAFRHFYQGVNRRVLTNLISVLQNLALTALFAFVLSRFWGTNGVWLAFLCGESATFIVLSILVFFKNNHRLNAEAYAMMRKDFGVAPENCLEMSVKSIADAEEAAARAAQFCAERDQDEQTCATVARCVGEMSKNVVEHGFTADGKEHSIDVRVWIKDDKKMVRIRDNCMAFDPVRYGEQHRFERSKSHAGIRTVMSAVADAKYVNALGLNNLTLVL